MTLDLRPPGQHEFDAMQATIDGVDEIARRHEQRWGVGRLELLVGDELREKFRRQQLRFNEAIEAHDLERVRLSGAAMKRAWVVLDQAATQAGQQQLQPEAWEILMPDGRVIALCRTNAHAHAEVRSGRHVEVWTVEEIARVISNFPEVAQAKSVFPGALVERIKPKRASYLAEVLDDEIPF